MFLNGDRSSETALNGIPPSGGGTDTSDATMAAGDLLAGKTGYGAEGVIEGTMTNNADNDVEITDVDGTTIPAGYYNGTGAAKLSDAEAAKVIAGNVKSGVTLLGVTGTLVEQARAVIESVLTVPTAPSLTITAEIQEE